MLSEDFWTIAEPGTAQTRVLGSRFSGICFPMQSEDDIVNRVGELKKDQFDASHHCWAFVLRGENCLLERLSDAGEPGGTAGKPILHELHRHDLQNAGVVVTRWFGGTKLGTGGLVRAYSECAGLALDSATRCLKKTGVTLAIHSTYDLQSIVYQLASVYSAPVELKSDASGMKMMVKLKRLQVDGFCEALRERSAGKLTAEQAGTWIS